MERQISHLVRLVDDLLEVSRITRGLIEVQREPLDLAFVLHSAIDTSRPAIDAAGHELSVELPTEPITVYGDTVRLTQVFANLLNNAAKYTQRRRSHLGPAAPGWRPRRRLRPRQRHRHRGRAARVGVRDVHAGRSVEPPGAGRARHRPDAGPQPGRDARRHGRGAQRRAGDRERVRRRAAGRRQRQPIASTESQPPADFPHRRILIVDDNRDAADTLGELLERARRDGVRRAQRPRGARRARRHSSRTRCCSTSACPRWTATRWRAASGACAAHRDLLLIALTGWGQEHDHRRSRAAGFDHHWSSRPTSTSCASCWRRAAGFRRRITVFV